MLVVETVVRIRREHANVKPIKAIARGLKLSRKAASPDRAFPGAACYAADRERGPAAGGSTADEPIHDLLHREGFEAAYDAVRRYASRWTAARRKDVGGSVVGGAPAFIPLLFQPGEPDVTPVCHPVATRDRLLLSRRSAGEATGGFKKRPLLFEFGGEPRGGSANLHSRLSGVSA